MNKDYLPRDEQFDAFGMESPLAPAAFSMAETPWQGEELSPIWLPPVAVEAARQVQARIAAIASPANPPELGKMLELEKRFTDPKRDRALEMDGTLFSDFLRSADRRAFAAKWLADRPALAKAAKEPQADLKAGDIAKAWFVIHDVGAGVSRANGYYYAAKKGLKDGSVHGYLNRDGAYAATHDFADYRAGTVYEFASTAGVEIAGGKTVNIETVPDVEEFKYRDGMKVPLPSNADLYASVGFRIWNKCTKYADPPPGKKRGECLQTKRMFSYYKWTKEAFDTLADLYILASIRAGHLLTVTVHKEVDRNLGKSVLWREYSASDIRNAEAAKKHLRSQLVRARDKPGDYHGDPFGFCMQPLYDRISDRLNALGARQMPASARYGIHPARVRKSDGLDITNRSDHLHEFPWQSDPVLKLDRNMKKDGWWKVAASKESRDEASWNEDEWVSSANEETDRLGEADYEGEAERESACGGHASEGEGEPGESAFADLEGEAFDAAASEDLAWLDLETGSNQEWVEGEQYCANCATPAGEAFRGGHDHLDQELEDDVNALVADVENEPGYAVAASSELEEEADQETESDWEAESPATCVRCQHELAAEEEGLVCGADGQFESETEWLDEEDAGFENQIPPGTSNRSFRFADLPPAVQSLLSKPAAWLEALDAAIAAGIKDSRRLADIGFFTRHPERMNAGVGKLINPNEGDFVWLRTEWLHDRTIAARKLNPALKPSVFLPERRTGEYATYVAPKTKGLVTLMPHGRSRSSSGTFRDDVTALNKMQEAVEALDPGDVLYIANWQFIPSELDLTLDRPNFKTWLDLLADKAAAGVVIRIIISFIGIADFMSPLHALDTAIGKIDEKSQDNLKYFVSTHEGVTSTYHQKFVVARSKARKVAFCGGLDISRNRAPNSKRAVSGWSTGFIWHDVQCQIEGKIVQDFEREFAMRWNLERRKTATKLLPGWRPFETLSLSPPRTADKKADKNVHKVQMLRTVSVGSAPADFRRDDIWQGYGRIIARASRFLYLENQYFREPRLADAIVRQAQSQKELMVMILVSTGTDDPQNMINRMANGLRTEFFTRLFNGIPAARRRVYSISYPGGLLHSKLVMADDEVLSVGSANANGRGFFFDSEVNVMLDAAERVRDFRHRLWAHNLAFQASDVAGWAVSEFFDKWDAVAKFNRDKESKSKPAEMIGESVIPFSPLDQKDPRFQTGPLPPKASWPLFES